MLNMRNPRSYRKQNSPKKNIGFYIALTICMATVGAAAWTTYGSVMDYNQLEEESSQVSQVKKVDNAVSGEKYESHTESSVSKTESAPKKEESKTAPVKPREESKAIKTAVEVATPRCPIDKGKVIKKFSPDNPIHSKTMSDWRVHNGIDIKASKGSPVRAITDGTVKMIYKDVMLGNIIAIEHHDGYTAYYCGLSDTPVVKAGGIVKTGDTLGYIDTVPSESLDESHLHLEVKKDDTFINPSTLF